MEHIHDLDTSRISCAEAFEIISRGAISIFSAEHLRLKWRNVKAYSDPDQRCLYCGFLSLGYTDIEQLQLGVNAGRQCCSVVWEAVHAWNRHEAMSLDGVRIFAWVEGYDGKGEELVGCSVLLDCPHEKDEIPGRSSRLTVINIFKSGEHIFPYVYCQTQVCTHCPSHPKKRLQ